MAHLLFSNRTKPNKKSKRATKPTHQDRHKMTTNNHDREEGQQLTAVWRNGGFWAKFEVGFVLAKSVFIRKFRLP